MSVEPVVLVVEDDEDDFFLTERTLRRFTTARIIHLESGRAAMDYFAREGLYTDRRAYPMPEVVFLDLKLDQANGHDVLLAVRRNLPDPLPKIYVLTGSNEPKDRELVRSSGMAAGYLVKPLSAEHLTSIFGPALR